MDELNPKYGIAHHEINPANILFDTDTDNLLLIDLGEASPIGSTGTGSYVDRHGVVRRLAALGLANRHVPNYRILGELSGPREADATKLDPDGPRRVNDIELAPDVHGVLLTVWLIITREPLSAANGWSPHPSRTGLKGAGWPRHPDANLEPGVTVQEYVDVAFDWALGRVDPHTGRSWLQTASQASDPFEWPIPKPPPIIRYRRAGQQD